MLKKVKTSLLEMAYEEKGDASGKPVILMHGFPDDAQTWNAVAEPLAADGLLVSFSAKIRRRSPVRSEN